MKLREEINNYKS